MRNLAWCGLVLLTLAFNGGCERAAYMEPREASEEEREQESEGRRFFREPGYFPSQGERERDD